MCTAKPGTNVAQNPGYVADTQVALYANDTKIWRSIKNKEDIAQCTTTKGYKYS